MAVPPPAPPVQPGDIFESRIQGILLGQTTITVLDWAVFGLVPAGIDPSTIANDLNGYITNAGSILQAYVACAPSNWTCYSITSQRLGPNGKRSVQVSMPSSQPGTAGASLTANLAQVVTRRTLQAGRSQVSDLHLPISTANADINNGQLTSARLSTLSAFGRSTIVGTGVLPTSLCSLIPVIYHRIKGQAGSWSALESIQSQPTVRTVRKRNIGIGF